MSLVVADVVDVRKGHGFSETPLSEILAQTIITALPTAAGGGCTRHPVDLKYGDWAI